jgi:hypothetical protein
MVVKEVSMEAWLCQSSSNGKDCVKSYVGSILFDNNNTNTGKKTHLAKTGKISVPLRGGDTLVAHAANLWNKSVMLPRALTMSSTKTAALTLAVSPRFEDVDLILRDLPRLLRLVGGLLQNVSRLHPLIGQVHREVGREKWREKNTIFANSALDASRTKIIFANGAKGHTSAAHTSAAHTSAAYMSAQCKRLSRKT